jgi:DNA-binding transcriptional MerR regulator
MPAARSHSLAELVNATGFDRRTIVYYIQSGLLPKVGRRGPHTRYPDGCLTRLLFIKGVRQLQADGQLLTATLAEMRRALTLRDADGIRDLLERGLPVDEVAALFASPAEAEAEAETAAAEPVPALETRPPPAPAPSIPAGAVSGPAGERRSYGLADAGIRQRFGTDRPPAPVADEIHHDETHPGLPALDANLFNGAAGTGTNDAMAGAARPTPAAPAPEASLAETELGGLLRELELRPTLNARRSPPGSPEQWTEIPITSRVYLSVRGLAAEDAPVAEAVGRLLKRALRARSSTPSA